MLLHMLKDSARARALAFFRQAGRHARLCDRRVHAVEHWRWRLRGFVPCGVVDVVVSGWVAVARARMCVSQCGALAPGSIAGDGTRLSHPHSSSSMSLTRKTQ